jgi:hypothetical protein
MSGHRGGIPRLDSGHANPARVYDYWLGGRENFSVDRRAAENAMLVNPEIVADVRAHRAFLGRAVGYLAGECGIRQFLDIGTGLPTAGSPHEVAQGIAPDARVVYVDNDPVVLSHARALLTSGRQGTVDYVEADLRDTAAILDAAASILDFAQPVAILLMIIVHLIPDADDPYGIVARLMRAVPAGSYLAMAHPASDIRTRQQAEMTRRLNVWMGGPQATMRDRAAVIRFFDGLELVDPGLVQPQQWRPLASPPGTDAPPQVTAWCGVGRKHLLRRRELGQRQRVAVGVGEPRHHAAARRIPDAILVLVHHVVPQERHAPGGQVTDDGPDVGNAPAENGVTWLSDLGDRCDADHGAVRVEDAREVRALSHRQAEHLLIEHARPPQIGRRDEGDDVTRVQHRTSPAEVPTTGSPPCWPAAYHRPSCAM